MGEVKELITSKNQVVKKNYQLQQSHQEVHAKPHSK